jgi:hypothetical protein
MTSQTIPRGHHPGPQRGKVLSTEPKLGAPFGFQCQDKTQGETKVLTSMMVIKAMKAYEKQGSSLDGSSKGGRTPK